MCKLKREKTRVLLVCERSGGHIFPAFALGKKIKETRACCQVYFFATSSFLKGYLEKEGFVVVGRSFPFRNLFFESFFRLGEAVYLLLKLRPKKVIGFGGRDSFFLVFFSFLLFRDTVIYEPNIKLGKTNRILSFFARKILRGFKKGVRGRRVKVMGIPLRENIKKIDKFKAKKILNFNDTPVILCMGGSQGSTFLNRTFLKLVKSLEGDFQIIHLTGGKEYFPILELYNKIERKKFVKDFYYSMEILYSAADLIISRAGASTLGEISYFGVPSILIPHPQAGGHQKENAFYFKEKRAAFVFCEDSFSFEKFKDTAENLLFKSELREKMKENTSNIRLGVSFEEFTTDWL